jgi:hypothetical protein
MQHCYQAEVRQGTERLVLTRCHCPFSLSCGASLTQLPPASTGSRRASAGAAYGSGQQPSEPVLANSMVVMLEVVAFHLANERVIAPCCFCCAVCRVCFVYAAATRQHRQPPSNSRGGLRVGPAALRASGGQQP